MFIGGYYPLMSSSSVAFGLQQTNQAILSSMNSAGPGSDMAALGASDKALALQHAQQETNYNYTYAWEQQSRQMEKKYWANRQQAIQNGYLF